jgi:hypothetical protein
MNFCSANTIMNAISVTIGLSNLVLLAWAQAPVGVQIVPGHAVNSQVPLPYAAIYEHANKGGDMLFIDNVEPNKCYNAAQIGMLNNTASRMDNFGNCFMLFYDGNCEGTEQRADNNNKEYLEILGKYAKDLNDKLSSFRLC